MGSLWMLAASFFFALMAAFTKIGADAFGTFELVFYRQIFAVFVLGAIAFATPGRTLKTRYPWGHFKRSILGTMALLVWFWALGRLPLGTAMTLDYTSPLFMAAIVIVLALRHREAIEWKLVGCVLLGFVGISLVLHPDVRSSDFTAGLIGLSAGFFAALAQFQIRQIVALKEPTYRIVFYFSLIGTIAGFGGHLAFEGPLTPITTDNVVPLLGVAICGMLAQLSLTRAWGGGNLLLTSSLQYSAIVFAAVIGLLFFDEPIDFLSGTGIAVIIIAGFAASLETKRKQRKDADIARKLQAYVDQSTDTGK